MFNSQIFSLLTGLCPGAAVQDKRNEKTERTDQEGSIMEVAPAINPPSSQLDLDCHCENHL